MRYEIMRNMCFYKYLGKRKRRTKNVIKFQFVHIKALFRWKGEPEGAAAEMGEFWQKVKLTRYGYPFTLCLCFLQILKANSWCRFVSPQPAAIFNIF